MFDKRPIDTGLQPQRTILSWFRTIAVIFLNALLLIKVGLHTESTLLLISGFSVLLLAVLMYAYSLQRNQVFDYYIEVVSQTTIIVHRSICVVLTLIASSLFYYFAQQLFIS